MDELIKFEVKVANGNSECIPMNLEYVKQM
jgi:hypothetical protein